MQQLINKETIQKFDRPGPRYTSYPTAPEWDDVFVESSYQQKLQMFGETDKTLSLYVHIPFCASLCSFCACNVVIRRRDPKYGDQYVDYLQRELAMVASQLKQRKLIRQLHFGGGTPTFLTSEQLTRLMESIRHHFNIDEQGEIAIEVDPRTIDDEKMQVLRQLGFNRLSMGVQDLDAEVQEAINRTQSFEQIEHLHEMSRQLGFASINVDLVYGLPFQSKRQFDETLAQVLMLRPDRVALYSFAYVPWLKHHQRKIDPATLPSADEKLEIFLSARKHFLDDDYLAIAMDHFALQDDEMAKAFQANKLYRNFMGYTVKPADEFIGVGVTSIGFLENTFTQNVKTLPAYYERIDQNILPVARGKQLSRDDIIRRWTINAWMCQFQIDVTKFKSLFDVDFYDYFQAERETIEELQADGLISQIDDVLTVTALGKVFIRNVCMVFDAYLKRKGGHQNFSRTV